MVGYHKLSGHKFEQTLRDGEKPGMLQSMGLQRAGHDLVTEQQQNIHPTGQAQFPMPTVSAVHAPDITAQQQHYELWDFSGGSADKEFTCNAEDPGSILGWENPLEKG